MNGSARPIALAGLAGAAAAALGIGVSEAIAGVIAGATSLVDAIGQVVIDLQPPGAKDFVVEIFGTNDKLALEIVVTLVALALGAAFGILAARRFLFGALGFAAFGVVGFLAALGQPLAMPAIVAVQAAAATAIAIQTLSWLLGRLMSAPSAPSIPDPARRSFLLRTSAVGIGAVAAGVFGRNAIASGNSAPAPTIPLPPPAEVVPPFRRPPTSPRPQRASHRSSYPMTSSTGSTRRSWCPRSIPRRGNSVSTASSIVRPRSRGIS